MAQERYHYSEPELCHYGYDLKRSWFIYFSIIDQLNHQVFRKQYRSDINQATSKEERIKRANALIKSFQELIDEGWNPLIEDEVKKLPAAYTVTEAFQKILDLKLQTLRKRAKETYSFIVRSFFTWLKDQRIENIPLKDFSQNYATQYMDYLITKKKYAGRTHNDHLIILKTFYNEMMSRDWIYKSPFRKIKKLPTTIGRNLAYSDSEREALKNLLFEKDRNMYYFSQIVYYCFIRRSELSQLKISAFDLVNHTITIPADISKNKIQESVVIPKGLEPVLKEMELHKYNPDDFIFGRRLVRSSEQYKNPNHISTRHNKFLSKLGIDSEKGLYSWKHTGACIAYYATGKDVYSVMRQLRHRDLNTTMIYLKSLGLIQNDVFRNAMVA